MPEGLEIKVTGKEKTMFDYRYWEHAKERNDGTKGPKKTVTRRCANKYLHLKLKQLVWTPAGNSLAPGTYEAGFAFQLPANCPSSLLFSDKEDIRQRPKFAITYVIEATLETGAGRLGHDFMFMVREALNFNVVADKSEQVSLS